MREGALYRAFGYHFIRKKRDEFTVGRLVVGGIYLYAEKLVYVFDLASVPGDLYRVTYRALDLGRRGIEVLRNSRVQFFRYAVYHFGAVNRHLYGFAQELISLYMRGDAHGNKYVRQLFVQSVAGTAYRLFDLRVVVSYRDGGVFDAGAFNETFFESFGRKSCAASRLHYR